MACVRNSALSGRMSRSNWSTFSSLRSTFTPLMSLKLANCASKSCLPLFNVWLTPAWILLVAWATWYWNCWIVSWLASCHSLVRCERVSLNIMVSGDAIEVENSCFIESIWEAAWARKTSNWPDTVSVTSWMLSRSCDENGSSSLLKDKATWSDTPWMYSSTPDMSHWKAIRSTNVLNSDAASSPMRCRDVSISEVTDGRWISGLATAIPLSKTKAKTRPAFVGSVSPR